MYCIVYCATQGIYNNHLKDNAKCDCGYQYEDAEHFFFRCPLYRNQRLQLFTNTRTYHPLSVNKLLFGIDNNTDNENSELFDEVQRYIKNSRRFEQLAT